MGRVGDSYRGRRRSACGLTWFQWGLLVSVLGIVSVGGLPALPDGYVTRTVVSGIGFSTDICFLPAVGGKDRFIVTQKDGLVLTVIGKNMLSEPFLDLRSIVNTHHDRGLTACEIHPGYPATPRAFFMYTVENDASQATKAKTAQVARFDITGSGNTAVRQSKVILLGSVIGPGCDKISMTADVLCADSFTHSTGGLAWDPDGNLFVTMGDGSGNKPSAVTMRATKGVSLNGKVLRIDPENGNGVPGNPLFTPGVLATSNKAKVWSLGCRNCWRIYYDTFIKAPVIAEVGWAAIEEVNVAFKNANLGWPCVEGTRQNAGFADFNRCRAFNAGQPKEGQRQDPMVSWTHQEGAAASAILRVSQRGSNWDTADKGWIYYTDYVSSFMRRVKTDRNGVVTKGPERWGKFMDGPVSMKLSPSKEVYYVSLTAREVRKILWRPDPNPPSVLITNPPNGAENVEISTVVKVTFSKGVTLNSLQSGFIVKRKGTLKGLPGTVTYDSATKTASLKTTDTLASNAQYVFVLDGIADAQGRVMEKRKFSFTTGSAFSVYVSDLEFERMENGFGPVERDRNNGREKAGDGGKISIRGETFDKGLGGTTKSVVTVIVPTGCTSLQGAVGIDDVLGKLTGGSLIAEIYSAGKQVFASPLLNRQSEIVNFNVRVQPAGKLRLKLYSPLPKNPGGNFASWGEMVLRCGRGTSVSTPPMVLGAKVSAIESEFPAAVQVDLSFSKDMDQSSLLGATRVLQGGISEVSWTPKFTSPKQMELTMVRLRYSTDYEVVISLRARDVSGTQLSSQFVFEFRTGLEPAEGLKVRLKDLKIVEVVGNQKNGFGKKLRVLNKDGFEIKQVFKRGLAMQAPTVVRYNVAQLPCTRFVAYVGIDSTVDAMKGNAEITVLTDGKEGYKRVMTASSFMASFAVSIAGKSSLEIRTRFLGSKFDGDHVILGGARLECTPNSIFLDTLKPAGITGTVSVNRNRKGKSMSLRRKPTSPTDFTKFKQGFRQHGRSTVTFQLPDRCSRFNSLVGVDMLSQDLALMRFKVASNRKGTDNCRTDKLGGRSGLVPLSCPVDGASTVSLSALSGTDKNAHNIGIWGRPTLECARSALHPKCVMKPLPGLFKVADVISYGGKAYNYRSEPLDSSKMEWNVILHHCSSINCHIHLFDETDGPGGSFRVPNHGDTFFFEIQCKVCDGDKCDVSTQSIKPITTTLIVETQPPGLTVAVGPKTGASPVSQVVVLNGGVSITATKEQNGLVFSHWKHSLSAGPTVTVVPGQAGQIVYTAVYKRL